MSNEYTIDPKQHRKNRPLIIFLCIFGIMWTIGSGLGLRKVIMESSVGGLFICLLCTVIVVCTSYVLFSMNRKQFIIIEDDHLLITDKRFTWADRKILKNDFIALQVAYAGVGASLMFLYLKEGRQEAVPIAPFIGLKGKIGLQQDISRFLIDHGLKFDVINKTHK